MSELGSIALWRLRENIKFGMVKNQRFMNGNSYKQFIPEFSRRAARYRISTRMIQNDSGIDLQHNLVFAVRHLHDVDLQSYSAQWHGDLYKVTHYLPDDSHIMTYDLITLKKVNKNG